MTVVCGSIPLADRNAIQAALNEANGDAKTHTFTDAQLLARLLRGVEAKLWTYLTPEQLHGVKVLAQSGAQMPITFKGERVVTQVTFQYLDGAWFVTEVARATVTGRDAGSVRFVFTPQHDQWAVARLRSGYSVEESR